MRKNQAGWVERLRDEPMVSMAHLALEKLRTEFVKVPDNRMGNDYDHLMVCHGCGVFHAVRCYFVSVPQAISFKFKDGSTSSVPAHSCGKCPGAAIYNAYHNGMTVEARKAAETKIGSVGGGQ